jgi:GGDEF domain-containing protein
LEEEHRVASRVGELPLLGLEPDTLVSVGAEWHHCLVRSAADGPNGKKPNRSHLHRWMRHTARTLGPGSRPSLAGKILVADEDPDLVHEMEEALRSQGHEVVTARTGGEVLRLAREHLPQLVILDLAIPGLSAHEVCRRLRSDWRLAEHGLFILTSESLSGQKAIALGAVDDFILKPFHRRELAARVRLAFRRVWETRSSSPLTGLPGNVALQEQLQRRVRSGRPVSLLYVDVDHFKAYNDRYGFLRGDEAIKTLAAVLRQAVETRPDSFLGHIGGDDFVVLAHPDEAEEIAYRVISGFRGRVFGLYDSADGDRGWIEVRDRRGRNRRYGLLTLSIGVATNSGSSIEEYRSLVDVATEMKQYAKSQPGDAVAVDRRNRSRDVDASIEDPVEPLWTLNPTKPARRGDAAPFGSRVGHRSVFGPMKTKPSRNICKPARHTRPHRGMLAYPATLLLLFGLVAGPVGVAGAQNARPGDLVWPLKLAVEDVQLFLERDPQRDIGLHLEFSSRRVADLQYAVPGGEDPSLVRTVTEDLAGHTGAAVVGLRSLSELGPPTPALIVQAHLVLQRNVDVLQALVTTACAGTGDDGPPVEACPGLRQAVASSQRSMGMIPAPPAPGGETESPMAPRPPVDGHGDPHQKGESRERSARGDGPGREEAGPGNRGQPKGKGESDGSPAEGATQEGSDPGRGSPPDKEKGRGEKGAGKGKGADDEDGSPPTPGPPPSPPGKPPAKGN